MEKIIIEIIKILPSLIGLIILIVIFIKYKGLIKTLIPKITKAKFLGFEVELKEELKKATEKAKNPKFLSHTEETSLMKRIEFVRANKIILKAIWIDDYPFNNRSESIILEEIGIRITSAATSEEASRLIQFNNYQLILSDIFRGNDPEEGIKFIKRLNEENNIVIPTILYTGYVEKWRGTPAYAFGICDSPSDLINYCLDIMERNIKNQS